MKKSMFIGVLLGCIFAAGVLYYQLWMPITTMGKYACLASESVYNLDYYMYVREKVKTDFTAWSEGYEYDAGKECKEVEKKRYLHSDTTYWQTGDTTHVTITEIYTFHKIDEADIVEHIETVSIPQAYDEGDLFILNKNSFPEFVTLYKRATESNYTAYSADPYNQTHYHTVFKNDYDIFPLDEEKYVGFRMTDADRFRYGWMKIMLFNKDGKYFVKLFETAIQE